MLKEICLSKGIEQEFIVPYSPQQNGVAERFNRTLVEMGTCLLKQANMSPTQWGQAILTSAYIKNRYLSVSIACTPFEQFYGKKPDISHFRIFREKCFAHVTENKRTKWEDKAVECKFLGYSEHIKGYKVVDIHTKKVFFNRDVKFIEQQCITRYYSLPLTDTTDIDSKVSNETIMGNISGDTVNENEVITSHFTQPTEDIKGKESMIHLRRSSRIPIPIRHYPLKERANYVKIESTTFEESQSEDKEA